MRVMLKAGKITLAEDRLIFETADKRGRADLPLKAEGFVTQLQSGVDIETFILNHQSRGIAVDYITLKNALLGLYFGDCIKNRGELTPLIESWSHPPLREPMLLAPIFRAQPKQAENGQGMFMFTLASVVFLAFILLAMPQAQSFFKPDQRFWLLTILAPSAALSATSLFFHFLSMLLGHVTPGLGVRLSPMGLHFEVDSHFYKKHPLVGLGISAILSVAMIKVAALEVLKIAPNNFTHSLVYSFFDGIALALLSMQLMPGLKTAWACSRYELSKRGKLQGITTSSSLSSTYLGFGIAGLCFALGFVALRIFDTLKLFGKPSLIWEYAGASGFGLLAIGIFFASFMLRDILSGLEELADDVELFKPAQKNIEKFWSFISTSHKERDFREVQEVLQHHNLFEQMPKEYRAELAGGASILRCAAGSRLIRQSSHTTELFILLSGSVGVYRRQYDQHESRLVVRLSPGSVFGEAGFFFNQERSADVIALDTVRVLRIKQPTKAIAKNNNAEAAEQFRLKMWATHALANSDLFRHLPNEALFQILNGSEPVRFAKGEIVILEEEPADSLLICVQGAAKVSIQDQDRGVVKAGDVIGEIGLIWNTKRTASVVASEDSIYLKLPAHQVRVLFSRNLFLAARLQELGAERLYRDKKSQAA